ncbi:MAG: cell division topological specificity factor MinE [Roseburia sp.]
MKHHSRTVAKERLRLMMDAEKNKLDEDTLWQIRAEIGSVITKYVNVDPENVEVKVLLKDYAKRG